MLLLKIFWFKIVVWSKSVACCSLVCPPESQVFRCDIFLPRMCCHGDQLCNRIVDASTPPPVLDVCCPENTCALATCFDNANASFLAPPGPPQAPARGTLAGIPGKGPWAGRLAWRGGSGRAGASGRSGATYEGAPVGVALTSDMGVGSPRAP